MKKLTIVLVVAALSLGAVATITATEAVTGTELVAHATHGDQRPVINSVFDCLAGIGIFGLGIVTAIFGSPTATAYVISGGAVTWSMLKDGKDCEQQLKYEYNPLMDCTDYYLATYYRQVWIFTVAERYYKYPCGMRLPLYLPLGQ